MADLLTVSDCVATIAVPLDEVDSKLVGELIDAAQETIEVLTGRSLASSTLYTEYHNAGHGYVYVDRPPIVSVTGLHDGAQVTAREISSDDWVNDDDDQGKNYRAGKVELWNHEGAFGGGRLDARICYTGGWTTSTIPADLRQGWIELVAFWYNNPERVGLTDFGDVKYRDPDVPDELRRVFRRYTIRRNY